MTNKRGWEEKRLGDHAYIKGRIGWRGLTSDEYTDDGPFLIAGTHIVNGRVHWSACDHISMYRYQESWEIALQEKDIILTKDGTIGRVAFIDHLPGPATINSTMMLVRAEPPLVPEYVYHYLNGEAFQRLVDERVSGSSVPHIFQRDMAELRINAPDETHQRYIANVLNSIDTGIKETEALINKLKQARIGFLHELLTLGVDETGAIRELKKSSWDFKTSPVGKIPKRWEVATISQLLKPGNNSMRSGPFGSALLKKELVSSGIPLLGIDNVYIERFVPEYTRFVSRKKYQELTRYTVYPGDVLVTIMGTVGRSCVAPNNIRTAISSKHVWTMSLNQDEYLPELLCAQINFATWVYRHFSSQSQGSTMPAVNSEVLRTTPVPVPPIDEQERILAIYQSHTARIRSEEETLDKLLLLKHGLMDDLFTIQSS